MLTSHGLWIELPAAALRERLALALQQVPLPGSPAGVPAAPLALVTSADAVVAVDPTVPRIRLWQGGRQPGRENPFLDPSTRHVLGATAAVDPAELASTLRHLAQHTPIGFRDLVPWPRVHRGFGLFAWEDRDRLHQRLPGELRQMGFRPDLADELTDLCDELVANAIYDAPVEAGRALFAGVSRKERVPLLRPVDVEFVMDEVSAAVLVRDHFGSLTPASVLGNLARCYQAATPQIDQKFGGAGLGLYQVLARSNRLVVNITPAGFTEAIVVRRVAQRRGELHATAPTFNLCHLAANDRRRDERRVVQLVAELSLAGTTQPCLVLDVTRLGAFLRPVTPLTVTVGDRVGLTVFDQAVYVDGGRGAPLAPGRAPLATVTATVRWVGESRRHGGVGLGVEFTTPTDALLVGATRSG